MANFFKDYLRENNLLTPEQIRVVQDDANATRSGTFYQSLFNLKILQEEVIIREACQFFGFLSVADAFKTDIDWELTLKLGSIDQVIARQTFFVHAQDTLMCVIPNPEIDSFKTAAVTAAGSNTKFALITSAQLNVFLQYQLKPKLNSIQSDLVANENRAASGRGGQDNAKINATAAQKLLDSLLECAIERRASDLHIRPMGEDRNAKVLLRVDGKIQFYTEIRPHVLENLRNLLKTMCKVGGEKQNETVQGQITTMHNGRKYDTRVNIIKTIWGFDFVLRFITADDKKTLSTLGLSEVNEEKYRRLLHLTKGMVLICGPTGSGKTTLLYAGLKERLTENAVIFTMEDPVEIRVPGMTQVEVDYARGDSYEKVFPPSLRQDPDIILCGEIREGDVARLALQAAQTGHLVLSTIHANDAVGSITRLIETGVNPYSLGDVLAGVVAQRLVRRVCPDCREEYFLPHDHEWRKIFELGDGEIKLARGRGCARCAGTGYFDRICINEIIFVDGAIRDAIQTRAPRSTIDKALLDAGFISYLEDGLQKALAGITTLDELLEYRRDLLQSTQLNKRTKEGRMQEQQGGEGG